MRVLIEYLGYRLLGLIVFPLPHALVVWLGRRLGVLVYLIDHRARRTGRQNLALALPGRTDHERILRESLRLQGVALLDALWAHRLTPARARRCLEVPPEHDRLLREMLARGRGLVAATAHFGSWEMLNIGAGAQGLPRATFIARPVSNPLIDAHLRRCREASGNRLVYREGALLSCLSALRNGEIACSVIDMVVSPSDGGLFSEFFGLPALTSGALAFLAHRRAAPLIFIACAPMRGGRRYRVIGHAVEVRYDAPRDEEIRRVARELNRVLEDRIREQPEAWIWSYKRWKARPSEEPGVYPRYSMWAYPHW